MKPTEHQLEIFFKVAKLSVDIESEVHTFFEIIKQTHPKLPREFIDSISRDFGTEYLLREAKALYQEQFSTEELDQLIQFWSSGVGRKLVSGEFRGKQQTLIERWSNDAKHLCLAENEKYV
ncbi:MAG: DUF2059 domain-containing protein [Candidatus Competibacteraceae bacterium]|nr:DUF2059 domain-containing protein [Candidatus Competibacteraceae bacterium]